MKEFFKLEIYFFVFITRFIFQKKYCLITITVFSLLLSVYEKSQCQINYVSEEQTVDGFSNFYLGIDFFESYVAVNPNDPLNLVCAFINSGYYTLNGLNWKKLPNLNSSDPIFTFDSLGNVYYAPAPPWPTGNNLRILKSTNKGVTWPNAYLLSNDRDNDKTCICGNKSGNPYSNYLYASWSIPSTGTYNHNLMFKKSTDSGISWTSKDMGHLGYCSIISIGPSGTHSGGMIYFGYSVFDETDTNIAYIGLRTSQDAGETFSAPKILSTFTHPQNLKNDSIYIFDSGACMQMAADNTYGPYRGNVYIVYCGKGEGADKADIFFLKSTNYGVNWTTPIKLNDDNTTNDQWMPAISVDRNGKIYADWYDSRFDSQNRMTKLYGTISTNGGASFYPDFPISTIAFDPVKTAVFFTGWSSGFIGDYISNAGINNTALASWTDGRFNTIGSFVGYFPDFAMTQNITADTLIRNDSTYITIKVPGVKGPFSSRINFSAYIDPAPAGGNISLSFVNSKDFMNTIPDSVILKIKSTSAVTANHYNVHIIGRSREGVPVHERIVKLTVNYNSGQTNACSNNFKSINDLQMTADTIQVSQPGIIQNVKVSLNINHSNDGDISIILYHQSKSVKLSEYNGAGGQNYTNTVFYDTAATSIIHGVPPFTGNFSPQNNLSGLSGKDVAGEWILFIYDNKAGDQGTLLNWCLQIAYDNPIGIKLISSETVKEFALFQNFPNPFNPFTKIKYQIKNSNFVSLKVYDILGKEITTLINEKQSPGKYEVSFGGSNFPSGIYFYKLEAGDFTDVKRMVLVK
jgi:subtilisin-like proprotein convertase family protein